MTPKERHERLKELSNQIFWFFSSQHGCLNNFGFYLFDNEFSKETELRNKLGCIWLCSLYDCLDGEIRVLPSLIQECVLLKEPLLHAYCDKISEMCLAVKRFFSSLTIEEQLFLQDYRNQLVHTWGSNVFQKQISVRYVKDGVYYREKMDRNAYRDAIRPFFDAGLDVQLNKMFGHIWKKEEPLLFGILGVFGTQGNLQLMHADIFYWHESYERTGTLH